MRRAVLALALLLSVGCRYELATTGDDAGSFIVWRIDRLTGKVCQVYFNKDSRELSTRCLRE